MPVQERQSREAMYVAVYNLAFNLGFENRRNHLFIPVPNPLMPNPTWGAGWMLFPPKDEKIQEVIHEMDNEEWKDWLEMVVQAIIARLRIRRAISVAESP